MNFKKIIYLSIFIFSSLVFSETVNLPNSNLIWQKCTYGLKGDLCKEGKAIMLTWEEASKICKDYKNDNLDWRLPEKEEIQSLISPEKQTPRIDENYFPSTLASNYWSIEDDSGYKNYISFYNGDFGKNVGSSKKAYLRCVANLAPEIDLRKKEFVKEIKENLPFNWYLSLEKSKIYLERGQKVWLYPAGSSKKLTEKKIKKIKKLARQKDCKIIIRVEEKWGKDKLKSAIEKNKKIKEDIKNLSSYSSSKKKDLEKKIIQVPEYEWEEYHLFITEHTCREDGFFTLYPKEAITEIKSIFQLLDKYALHYIE